MTCDAKHYKTQVLNKRYFSQGDIFFRNVTEGLDKRGLKGPLYLVQPVQILYRLAILTSAQSQRGNHMKPTPVFTDQTVGRRRIKATTQASIDVVHRRPRDKRGTLKTKRTDETKWTKEGARDIFPVNVDACILLPFHLYQSHFPHPLRAPAEITGELSVCGKACLSSGGSEEGTGVSGGRKTEKTREN